MPEFVALLKAPGQRGFSGQRTRVAAADQTRPRRKEKVTATRTILPVFGLSGRSRW
ncbi:MAG: hypothetical protein IPN03_18645 [Holophagales bacterium]|nr:hypothetical protein [Holophagales bacterium]